MRDAKRQQLRGAVLRTGAGGVLRHLRTFAVGSAV